MAKQRKFLKKNDFLNYTITMTFMIQWNSSFSYFEERSAHRATHFMDEKDDESK